MVQGGKLGYYKVGSGISCEPRYALKNMDFYGITARFTDMKGDCRLLAADGVETVLAGLTVPELDFSDGRYYIVNNRQADGLIDWHGKELLPMEFREIRPSRDGQYVVVRKDYDDDAPAYIYRLTWTDDAPPVEGAVPGADASDDGAYASSGDPLAVGLQTVATLKDVRWIMGSDLLESYTAQGRALTAMDGTALSEPVYSYFSCDYGWITAEQGSVGDENYAECLMNGVGETIIPPGCQIIVVDNKNWAVAKTLVPGDPSDYDYNTTYGGKQLFYRYGGIDIYHLPDSRPVLSFVGDEVRAMDYSFKRDYVNVNDKRSGTTTTYDSDSNALGQTDGLYDWKLLPRDDGIVNGTGNKLNLKDADGNVIPSDEYSVAGEVLNALYPVSNKAGRVGLADTDGNSLIPMEL